MLSKLGRALLAATYVAVPIVGWYLLARSFKLIREGEISTIRNFSGSIEIIEEPGIYFRPFPGDSFDATHSRTEPYIDFGPIKRVFVGANQSAVKMDAAGEFKNLVPGYNLIEANETYKQEWLVDNTAKDYTLGNVHHVTILAGEIGYAIDNSTGAFKLLEAGKHELPPNLKFGRSASLQDDIIDFPSMKIVRIKEGYLGVKTNEQGLYEVLKPGIHTINTGRKETFDPKTGIQQVTQADFTLGNTRYIRICDGELGESYKEGMFQLLKPGLHELPPNHVFVKKVKVDSDIVDLGALKIVTVKEGQVAIINTTTGVDVKGPGKYDIKQEEGTFFNTIITTSLQGIALEPLDVICSDQIEMTAKSMVMYTIKEPLKTVGLGIDTILKFLTDYSDGILRSILSRFNSNDLSPPIHQDDEHTSAKRAEKLQLVHDSFVSALNEKAQNWGLTVTDLQITEILPTDEAYLKTLQSIGVQQVEFIAQQNIAQSAAEIAKIKATSEKAMVIAAENEQRAELVKAETSAKVKKISTTAETERTVELARAEATAISLTTGANAARITALNNAMQGASKTTQDIMVIEAQGKVTAEVMKHVKDPKFVQPGLGDTSLLTRDGNGITLFSTRRSDQQNTGGTNVLDLLALDTMRQTQTQTQAQTQQ